MYALNSGEEFSTLLSVLDKTKELKEQKKTANQTDEHIRSWMGNHAKTFLRDHETTRIDTSKIGFDRVKAELKQSNQHYPAFLEERHGETFSSSDRDAVLDEFKLVDFSVQAFIKNDSLALSFFPIRNYQSQRSFDPIELLVPPLSFKSGTNTEIFQRK